MKKNNLLAVVIAAAWVGSFCSASIPSFSLAAEETKEYTSGDWTYTLVDGGCAISGYNGSDKAIVIPSTLDGKTVIEIGEEPFEYDYVKIAPFRNNKEITSVTIPDTVQTIGSQAFYNCTELANIDLGNSVKILGYNCFYHCPLSSIVLPASMTASDAKAAYPFQFSKSLKTVTIESGGVGIPATLFCCCLGLEKITIPEGITTIGERAFGESALKEITIPDSLQDIEDRAFEFTNLTEMVLPKGIHSVSYRAFNSCKSLKDFYDYNEYTEYIDETKSSGKVWTVFESSPVTIHGYPGSNAEAYAAKHDIPFVPLSGDNPETPAVEGSMYRLYNPNSGEHFYTKDASEKSTLVRAGWKDEGIGWIAPERSNTPVYRLYNENAGDHHYTIDASERDNLIGAGWKDEGIGWYSDDDKTVPLYREYNPNAVAGTHNYTTDKAEHDKLVRLGWKDEGIGWYGKAPSAA